MSKRKKKFESDDSLKLTAKKHPVKGIISTFLGILSLVLFLVACVLSAMNSGQAAFFVGIMGFVSMLISIIGAVMAWSALREPDIFPVFPSIGGILNALLTFFYIIVYIWGFYG